MSDMRTRLDVLFGGEVAAVERALAEFRGGRPVLLTERDELLLVLGVEALDEDIAERLQSVASGRARLIMPAARLRRIGLDRRQVPGVFALPTMDIERIAALTMKVDARYDAPVANASSLDEAALELAQLALVLPGLIGIPVDAALAATVNVVRVDAAEVRAFRKHNVADLKIVSRAPVPLEYASHTEFVVFRGGEGMRDQVAVIVGNPDLAGTVDVRLHSACLTGDLFGSLKCDCGDQLRETVRHMAQHDGGILLYLDQEGRGNGISNKMKAYALQAQGWDTYDADEVLGFGLDQRRFDFAAKMLTLLGVSSVRLMTNNPLKLAAMRDAGIEVAAEARVLGRPNAENVRYLASKRDRAGHMIDFEALAARAKAGD